MVNDKTWPSLTGKKKSSPAEGQLPLARDKQPSTTVGDNQVLGTGRAIITKPQPGTAAAAKTRTTTTAVPPLTRQPKVSTTTKPPLPPWRTQQPKVSTTTKPPLPPHPVRPSINNQLSEHDVGGDHRRAGKRSAVPDRGPISAYQSFPWKRRRTSSSSSSSGGAALRSKTLPPSSLPFKKRLTQAPWPETSIIMMEDDRPVKKNDTLRQEHLAAAHSKPKSGVGTAVQDTPAGVRLSGSSHGTSMKPGCARRGLPPRPPPRSGDSSSRPGGGKKVVGFAHQLQDGPNPTLRR